MGPLHYPERRLPDENARQHQVIKDGPYLKPLPPWEPSRWELGANFLRLSFHACIPAWLTSALSLAHIRPGTTSVAASSQPGKYLFSTTIQNDQK